MRPSRTKPGTALLLYPSTGAGTPQSALFVRREPAEGGRSAVNYIRIPAQAGLNGPDDDGTCTMSDYDLRRRRAVAW